MSNRYINIGLINSGDNCFIQPNKMHSFSLQNCFWEVLLFLKIHSIWRLQYFAGIIFRKPTIEKINSDNLPANEKPLVYSCSGCSSAAQMANYLAIQMDRDGVAEMSCIAGVGGNVKKLVRTANSGKKIIVIDGCPLACAKACLANHNITPDMHVELTGLGVSKKQHEDFDLEQAKDISKNLREKMALQNM